MREEILAAWWQRVADRVGIDPGDGPPPGRSLGHDAASSDERAASVVLDGRASVGALADVHTDGVPEPGVLTTVLDGRDLPVALVETTTTEVTTLAGLGPGVDVHRLRADGERRGIAVGDDTRVVVQHVVPRWPRPDDGAEALHADGLLVDLDGVLADSIAAGDAGWARWLSSVGIDPDTFELEHGTPASEVIAELRPELDVAEESARLEQYEIEASRGIDPQPGARRVTARLAGGPWAIVTSGTRRLATVRLGEIGIEPPATFVTADDVTRGKPDPEPYRRGAAGIGIDPSRCIVFEDAPAGVTAARAAGATPIGLATTHEPAALSAATRTVTDLADVLVLRRPGGWTVVTTAP